MEQKLRVAIVGVGGMGEGHLESYSRLPHVEVVAICDINQERLDFVGEKHGIEKRYLSETEMLAKEELDAVSVCTWNSAHAKCSIEALNAGKHVLCEKPMACSAEEATEMLEAAKKNNRLLMIGFVMRFYSETKVAMDYIEGGYLGDIYYSKATYLRRHGSPGGWFTNKSMAGGGPIIDLGVHVIDQTRYLMGNPRPVSVYAMTSERMKDRSHLKAGVEWLSQSKGLEQVFDVEDFGVALIRYEGGKGTLLETSYDLNGQSQGKKELFGTKGGIKMEGKDFTIFTELNDYLVDVTPQVNLSNGLSKIDSEIAHFVDCIQNGTACIAPGEDGLTIMRILDAIYESARTGREVLL